MDENSTRKLLIAETRDLGIRIIIATEKGNVKSEGVDEKSEGGFLQKATGTLGMESIITSAKRIVKFREADESSAGQLLAEGYRSPTRRISSPPQKEM